MRDRVQLPFHFDAVAMQHELKALEEEGWIDHFVTQNYEGIWSVIPLRGPAGAEHPVMMIYSDPSCKEFASTPFLEKCPYFQSVLSHFDCPLQAARLMKLTEGSVIKEHCDHELSLEDGFIRIHIPVVTHSDVEFYVNQKRVVMNEGECWYLRLSDPHSVANRSPIDRVHLVIDAEVNDWVKELLVGQLSER